MDYKQEQLFRMQQPYEGSKLPFYMAYPMQNMYMTEIEYERDMERMKELYPKDAKDIQRLVEEACDKMEYDGSLMFDEYPDRLMLRRICDQIYQKAKPEETIEIKELEEAELSGQGRPMFPPPPPGGPGPWGPPPGRPGDRKSVV